MKSLVLTLVALAFTSFAYGGEKSRFYLINGEVKECEIGIDGEPVSDVSPVKSQAETPKENDFLKTLASDPARVLTPVPSYRTVCENGVCRTIEEITYVESEPPTVSSQKPAAVVWATPTGAPMATNATCTTCGQSQTSAAYATNSGAFPFVKASVEHFQARPKLLNGNFRKRIAAFFGR